MIYVQYKINLKKYLVIYKIIYIYLVFTQFILFNRKIALRIIFIIRLE